MNKEAIFKKITMKKSKKMLYKESCEKQQEFIKKLGEEEGIKQHKIWLKEFVKENYN